METDVLIGLASIIVLGIAAQWVSWRLHLPSILLLLLSGFVAGPVTGFINPDELFGELLFPVVSLSVGLILFEGGLSLKLSELKEIGGTLRNLIIFGSAVTWAGSTAAGVWMLGLDVPMALLLGAVLIVTGPTVIVPLLRQVRPTTQLGTLLKWEGILIDPVGATVALLVFETIVGHGSGSPTSVIILAVVKTIVIGGLAGAIGALIMTQTLKRYLIPDFLQNPVTIMVVVAAFTVSNVLQHESGLLAVTVMGIILANQKSADIHHIVEFKENLRVLLISGLFIVLSARMSIEDMKELPMLSIAFVAVLILVVRPVAVAVSTAFSTLSRSERLFTAWLAPRGIVAAAVSSVFAIRLAEEGHANAEILSQVTFLVIVGTVTVYGLSAAPVARWLGVAQAHPHGVLILGAHRWARELAAALQESQVPVLMADTNRSNIYTARMKGIRTYYGNILSENSHSEYNIEGIGHLMALTPNDETNCLAALHFTELFGRAEVYQLHPDEEVDLKSTTVPSRLRGRQLFSEEATFSGIRSRLISGSTIKRTPLTAEFGFDEYREKHGENAIPLLVIEPHGQIRCFTSDDPPNPEPGDIVVGLVKEVEK